jgi:ABC-2 type transport system permease protein
VNLLRSEWIKLVTVRSHKAMLGLAMLLPIGFAVLVGLVVPANDQSLTEQTNAFALATSGLGVAALLVASTGVLLISAEFAHGTSRVTFAASPRRGSVMVAKAVAGLLAGLLVGIVAVPLALAVGLTILNARGFDVTVGGSDFWRAAAGSVVLLGLYGVAGLGVGAILRSSAAGIVTFVLFSILVEPILSLLLGHYREWLPFSAGQQLASLPTTTADTGLGPWLGGLYFLGFVVLLWAAGTVLVRRRDA